MLLFVAMLGLSAPAFAQKWILPAKTPGTPVSCPTTICKNGTFWLAPYQLPLASFTGRFLDSSGAGDSSRYPIATVRAMSVKSLPGSDRFYLHMNASVAMYKKASFIDRLSAGEALMSAESFPGAAGSRRPEVPERILSPDAAFAAPFASSSWVIPTNDFTPQLGSIDVDDQGYVYLAYWEYGFGIIKDLGNGFQPYRQITDSEVTPKVLITMKTSGGRYYTLLSDVQSDTAVLYDVTDRTAPQLRGRRQVGIVFDAAKNTAQDRVALLDTAGTIRIYSADTLENSNALLGSFTSADGGKFQQVVSDGTNFYGVARTPNYNTSLTVFTPAGSAYTATKYDITVKHRGNVTSFAPTSANFSDGYLTIGGGFGNRDLRVFRVGFGAPVEVEMNDYMRDGYDDPPPSSTDGKVYATAKTAVFSGTNQLISGSVMRVNGKEYFIVNAKGLGDVYELKGSDSITLKVDGPAGTANPRTAPSTTLFYGDPVKFTATGTNSTAQTTLQWDFGNAEGTVDPNITTGVAGQSVVRRYSGIAKSALTARTVKAASVSNPSANDTKTVTFAMPKPRIGVVGLSASKYIFEQGGATTVPVVVGDQFFDASDGLVEGHISVWNLDGVDVARTTPSALVPVGTCGAHTLTMSAHYGPYSGSGSTLATINGADFTLPVANLAYNVRPFVADIELSSSSATSLTFSSTSRVSVDANVLPATAAAALAYKWELVGGTGAVLLAGPSGTGTAIPTFPVPRTALAVGSKARLTLTSPTLPGACAGKEVSVAESALLNPPDPVIVGDCTNGAPPCSFTINSVSGVDPVAAGWTYSWTSSGSANTVPATSTARTWAPSFSATGTYLLTVTATNAITSAQATKSVIVTKAGTSCGELTPTTFAVTYLGSRSSCTNGIGNCFSTEGIDFGFSVLDSSYNLNCAPHTFLWSFPGGATSNAMYPPVTRIAASGNVTLTVNNGAVSQTYTVNVPIGAGQPPVNPPPVNPPPVNPPPVNPPPVNPPPSQGCAVLTPNVSMSIVFANTSYTCSNISQAGCKTGESLQFYVTDFQYNSSCAPHTFSWTFGDGSTATGRDATHTFTTNNTYQVRCNVTVNGQTYALTQQIAVGGGGSTNPPPVNPPPVNPPPVNPPPTGACSPFVPNVSMSIAFQNPSNTCTNVSQAGCSTTDTIEFFAGDFNYNSSCAPHTFAWDFGDGSTASGRGASHKYASNGNYTVKCNVTVNGQTYTLTQPILVGNSGSGAQPEVEVDFSSAAANGRTYTFTPMVLKTVNAQIARWDWDFGDGTSTRVTSTQPLAKSNTYAASGTYSVTLTVYDSSNRVLDSHTRQVVVGGTNRSRAVRH